MADSSKRSDDAGWDDLDQAFFASAPPDVPGPAPEPERFDDLFPATTAAPEKRDRSLAVRRASAAAATARATLRRAWGAGVIQTIRQARPAIASAGRLTSTAWRASLQTSARSLGAAGRAASRTLRAVLPAAGRLAGALRVGRLNGQTVAIVVASMMLVTGLSAVVVAARGSGHGNLPSTPLGPRAGARATVAAATPSAAAMPFPTDPKPSRLQSLAPDPDPPTPDPEPPARARPSQDSNQSRHRQAEPAKRPVAPAPKHRRAAASYSAEKDLMLPSFMQERPPAPRQERPQAAPAAPPTRQAPPPASAPAAPPARQFFSR